MSLKTQIIRLMIMPFLGIYRIWVPIFLFLGSVGSARRSDYWEGDTEGIVADPLTLKKARKRRRKLKNAKETYTNIQPKTDQDE